MAGLKTFALKLDTALHAELAYTAAKLGITRHALIIDVLTRYVAERKAQ